MRKGLPGEGARWRTHLLGYGQCSLVATLVRAFGRAGEGAVGRWVPEGLCAGGLICLATGCPLSWLRS